MLTHYFIKNILNILASLMLIAWMLFVPIGVIFARYFKFIFPDFNACNVQFWFFIHKPLMISVPIISITAFILALAAAGWAWVSSSSTLIFAHSIIGIIVIGLSIVQVK
jgi:hypothetical protein